MTESEEIEIIRGNDAQNSLKPNLSRYKLFNPLLNRFDHWFDDLWRPFETLIKFPSSLEPNFRIPLINISEDDKKYKIDAELPGLDKEDIKISVIDDRLEIKGENESESNDEKENFTRREYQSSSYYRRFKLPKNADKSKIDAELKNGRLEISMPKLYTEKKEEKIIKIV
ncbi:MAG: Hsp20/alpha crystallin family protein [Candidatus Thorarchaeota archaeon]